MPPVRTSQVELPLGLEAYRNTALFSDHFLAERLPTSPWFHRARRQSAREALKAIAKIFEDAKPQETLKEAPEAQCEEDIIKPVLTALGHAFLVQTATSAGGTKNFPDYALFSDSAIKDAARPDVLVNNFSRAIGIVEGKYWDRPLDKVVRTSRDYLTNANPSFQIVNYLTQTGQRWGILTNGNVWRLYNRDSPQPLERFYEVDLLRLIRGGSGVEAFLHYFWGFFSREALTPISGGLAHTDNVLRGSADFAADVGAELRSRVFAALARLSAGLVKGRAEPVPQADLDEIYDNSLIVLYRLLFVLYAESRDLLPLESNEGYRENLSLFRLVRQVADSKDRHRPFSSTSTAMWSRLRALWEAIDRGDPDLGVPAYDGELFAQGAHTFLEANSIADLYLADALDLAARVPGEAEARFVDYRSLSVAHLGTVYEGLLENHLEVHDDQLGAVEERIRLAPIRGRRRETGSYYTPDPVVQHIAVETLDPLIAGKNEAEILKLKIVDPAMGSGHFLVAAVEYLALAIATSADEPRELDEEDLATIKRRVVEHCIWGVDINPLAVELAKLSLWLATASADKPLSFIDHRLRAGNSVMSQRPEDVLALLRRGRRRQEASLVEEGFERQHQQDLEIAEEIENIDPDSMEGVEERRELFREQQLSRERLRELFDVAAARAFGAVEAQPLEALALELGASKDDWANALAAVDSTLPVSDDYEAFHWELEFPEVFEHGGFDAVLGNPPYVNAWEMTASEPLMRQGLAKLGRWGVVARGHWDLFVLFVGLAQQLLVPGGRFGLILANPIMREKYATALRGELLEGTFESVVDFEDTNVFEDVARETVVLIWEKTPAPEGHEIVVYDPVSIVSVA
jgi:Eco57I restriction-modification methylase/N-6 DNA Methylase